MIYFNNALIERVHRLLYESLGPAGILGLGDKESVRFTSHGDCYEELDGCQRLYRKIR
jgi:chemotaxis protein methyltransferase CheR